MPRRVGVRSHRFITVVLLLDVLPVLLLMVLPLIRLVVLLQLRLEGNLAPGCLISPGRIGVELYPVYRVY